MISSHLVNKFFDKIASIEDILFHGSEKAGLKVLEPHVSTHGSNWVYATPDKVFGAVFAGNARDHLVNSGTINGMKYISEVKPGAFKEAFDKPGSLYTVAGKGFTQDKHTTKFERVTPGTAEVLSEENMPNILRKLEEHERNGELYIQRYQEGKDILPTDKELETYYNKDKTSSTDWLRGNALEKLGQDKKGLSKNIPEIDNALSCPIARKVATMMATSHEYKKPNIDGALAMTKNYDWKLTSAKVSNLQGLDKPINQEKVNDMNSEFKGKKVPPLIVVNSIHGVKPQSQGKKIVLDGHHRLEYLRQRGVLETPCYLGTYTGGAQLSKGTLRASDASESVAGLRDRTLEKMAFEGPAE